MVRRSFNIRHSDLSADSSFRRSIALTSFSVYSMPPSSGVTPAVRTQGHRIKIGGLGRMANPAFRENMGFCGTFSHISTIFVVALVIVNKYNVYVQ